MKLLPIVALVLAAAAPSFDSGLPALAQDKQDPPQMPKPGKEHELLKQFVGDWDAECRFQPDPKGEAMVMKGSMSSKMMLNGFWLLGEFKGDMFGQPFEGRSTMSYDPLKKKYVGTWIDSMMPHIFASEGDVDAAGKVFTFIADGVDMNTGKPSKEKWTFEIKGADEHVMTMYGPGPDGKEVKTGTITYKRKK